MKKITILIICLFTLISIGKAQYVNVPDANFKTFLQGKYPTAFNGTGQMDTTNSLIANEDSMNCSFKNISDLSGIQYFDNLKYLTCRGNTLSNLHTLPNSLMTLVCNDNFLTNLPTLPNNLISLLCSNNFLNSLPVLPNSLTDFSCIGNQLTSLPTLPNSLISLACDLNQLTSLPTLPNSLNNLFCDGNKNLKCLPVLPVGLTYLNVDTAIHCLPNIPSGLTTTLQVCNSTNNPNNCPIYSTTPANYVNIPDTNFGKFLIAKYPSCLYKDSAANKYYMDTTCSDVVNEDSLVAHYYDITNLQGIQFFKKLTLLDFSGNKVTTLPDIQTLAQLKYLFCVKNDLISLPLLPNSLIILGCTGNKLKSLPNLLNTSLQTLGCFINDLSSLPELPNSLTLLACENNNIYCLPKLPTGLTYISYDTSKVLCLPNKPSGIINFVTLTPICNLTNNPNQCFIYSSVSGTVFTDNNSNAVKDTLEFVRPFVKLSLNNGQYTYSNLQGAYGISVDTLGSYTLKVTPPPYYKAVPDSVTINFSPNNSVVLPDIALQPIANVDSFAIHIAKLNRPRPGFKYVYNVSYENVGTISSTINNIIPISYDTTKLHFDSASVTTQSGAYSNVEVNAGKLIAGQGGSFNLYFTVKSTVLVGDSIKIQADIIYANTKAYDIDSARVVGSFDPNDKEATPELSTQQVADGKRINYTIRFENTGNDTAIHIVIADTLYSKLQANSLQMIATSHNCKTTIKDGIVYFEMRDIMLPDSNTNKLKCSGFVRFSVLPQSNLVAGDIIPNNASIYFDYNKPVVTNTATTTIKNILLPLQMLDFTASLKDKNALLSWQTTNEINTQSFVIQQSLDGRVFKSVNEVVATNAHHYTTTTKLDDNINCVYFRLIIKDKDGSYTYSKIVKLTISNEQSITILINPVKAELQFVVSNNLLNTTANIINANGVVVKQFIVINTSQKVSIANLPKGLYYLQVKDCSKKFIVE